MLLLYAVFACDSCSCWYLNEHNQTHCLIIYNLSRLYLMIEGIFRSLAAHRPVCRRWRRMCRTDEKNHYLNAWPTPSNMAWMESSMWTDIQCLHNWKNIQNHTMLKPLYWRWQAVVFKVRQVDVSHMRQVSFNPLSPHDALKYHFTSLKTDLIFLQLGVSEGKFLWN